MKAVSGEEMCRALRKKGWTLVRVRGSHHRFEKPGHGAVTVPVHKGKTLRTGTQRGIMKDAGITEDDL
jgi:predicted RNA binding protein YcfA (HicA-like mRNA interferase family)